MKESTHKEEAHIVEEQKEESSKEHHSSSVKSKLQEKIDEIKKSDAVAEIRSYTKSNKIDSIVMACVVLGVLLTWFNPPLGLGLVGVIIGIYFTDDITTICKQVTTCYNTHGWFKIVLFIGGLLSLLITAWAFIVGIAIAIGGKSIFNSMQKSS